MGITNPVLFFFFLERQDLNSGLTISPIYYCHAPFRSAAEIRGTVTPAAPGDFSDQVRTARVTEVAVIPRWGLINNAAPVLFLEGYVGIGGARCENTIFPNPRVTDMKQEGTMMHL